MSGAGPPRLGRSAGLGQHSSVSIEVPVGILLEQPLAELAVERVEAALARGGTRAGGTCAGRTGPACGGGRRGLGAQGVHGDTMRIRAFPFPDSVADFIADHEQCFLVEQNRDAQLRSLIVNELNIDPAQVMPVLHYDGTPITARFIANSIADHQDHLKVTPLRKVKS